MAPKTFVIACLLPGLLAGLFAGCGYHLTGTGENLPESLETVYIPNFKNGTSRFQAEEFVTAAVRREFLSRSRLKLVEDVSRAHAVLEGEVRTFDVKPVSYSATGQANLYTVTIRVDVRFLDLRTDAMIYEGKMLSFSDQYEIDSGDFFTQESISLERIARQFASSVVSQILENF